MDRNIDEPEPNGAGKDPEGTAGPTLTQAQREFARLLGRLLAERWCEEQRNKDVGAGRKL
jgi:hypothetical protein